MRALSDFLGIAAFRGGRRAVVLAPAESMNAVAANTLLKMLEEPPPATTFVLASDALDEVLPTIRSRCVLVQVPAPPAGQCLPWLREQGLQAPAEALALASGAPLAALAVAGEGAGSGQAEALYRLLERGPRLTAAEVAAGVGRDPPVSAWARSMQCWAFDLLMQRTAATVRYHPLRSAALGAMAGAVRMDALWRLLAALADAAAVREHPLNARLAVEALLTRYIEIFERRR